MRIENDQAIFEKMPPMVVVRPYLSKAGHQYFTFLSKEGCEHLKNYLMRGSEQAKKYAKITHNNSKVRTKPFIREKR